MHAQHRLMKSRVTLAFESELEKRGESVGAAEQRVLQAQFNESDPMVAVIVLATYAEYVMSTLLRTKVKEPSALGKRSGGLQYQQMLKLVLALDALPADLADVLSELAKIRNGFAHDINHELTESQAARFTQLLPIPVEDFRWARVLLAFELLRCLHSPRTARADFIQEIANQFDPKAAPDTAGGQEK